MGERRLILAMPAGTVFSGNGDTATNLTTVSPAPAFTADQQFPLPGVIGWAAQSGLQIQGSITSLPGASTIQFFVEALGGDGSYYTLYETAVISATGSFHETIGPGYGVPEGIDVQGRVRWAVNGSSATGSVSLMGL
jgi:hypothetical protein